MDKYKTINVKPGTFELFGNTKIVYMHNNKVRKLTDDDFVYILIGKYRRTK